ncbi:MAG: alpha/beta hydrolase fold protein [Caulobacter sp.]|nr:alpha/beta hydrolase fold protein [Caulobacter sp.]
MSTPRQPPLALTVSAEARKSLDPILNAGSPPRLPSLVMQALAAPMQRGIAKRRGRQGVTEVKGKMAGVPVRIFTRQGVDAATVSRMLINVHGGGFEIDAGSLSETIPLAARMEAVVVAVRYRLAPKHPWPAAVDDLLAVYREALKSRPPERIAVYGTSAGAVLTSQFLARLKAEGLPMPAAAGVFSGSADFSRVGDCEAYLPPILSGETSMQVVAGYVGKADRTDPLLSPIYSDLSGLPPTLLLTSTRDQLLSGTVNLHRALRRAGVAAELEVYDGLPHAFWTWVDCPETEDAFDTMASFFERTLSR